MDKGVFIELNMIELIKIKIISNLIIISAENSLI